MIYPCPHCGQKLALDAKRFGLVVCFTCLEGSIFDLLFVGGSLSSLTDVWPRRIELELRKLRADEMTRVAVPWRGRPTTTRLTVEDLLNETRNQRIWCALGHPKPRIQVTA